MAQDEALSWQPLDTRGGITINQKTVDCYPNMGYDSQYTFLQLKNTSDQVQVVSWNLLLWYNEECKTCVDPNGEYTRIIKLQPNESLEGSCAVDADYRVKIFSKFIDPQYTLKPDVLTKFELDQLNVSPY